MFRESTKLNFSKIQLKHLNLRPKATTLSPDKSVDFPARWKRGIVFLRTVFIRNRCDVPFSRYRRLKATLVLAVAVLVARPFTDLSQVRWSVTDAESTFFFFLFFPFFFFTSVTHGVRISGAGKKWVTAFPGISAVIHHPLRVPPHIRTAVSREPIEISRWNKMEIPQRGSPLPKGFSMEFLDSLNGILGGLKRDRILCKRVHGIFEKFCCSFTLYCLWRFNWRCYFLGEWLVMSRLQIFMKIHRKCIIGEMLKLFLTIVFNC